MRTMFLNKTKYTNELCDSYCKFHRISNFNYESIINAVILLGLISIGIFSIYNNIQILLLATELVLSVFVVYIFMDFYIESISIYEVNTKISDQEFIFTFYENSFSINSNKKFCILNYDQLYKIRVTDEYTYLYTNKSYAFVIKNSNFSIGDDKQFKKFLKDKCKFKYREIKYANA